MSIPVDPGTGLQDDIDYIYLSGTTGLHARFSPLYTILSGGLSSDNLNLSSAFAWTGIHSFQSSELKLGDSDASHKYIFAGSDLAADRTVTLPLLAANDTFVMESFTQTLTNKTLTTPTITSPTITGTGAIAAATGVFSDNINVAATKKVGLNVGLTTYWTESAANVASLYCNSAEQINVSSTLTKFLQNVSIEGTNKLILDGSGGTLYWIQSSSNVLDLYVNSALQFKQTTTLSRFYQNLSVEATNKLGLNPGLTSYFIESSSGVLDTYIASTKLFSYTSVGATITGDFIPNADSTYDLGSTTEYFNAVYADQLIFNAVGAANPIITTNGTGTIEISCTNNGSSSRTLGLNYAGLTYVATPTAATGYVIMNVNGTDYKFAVAT